MMNLGNRVCKIRWEGFVQTLEQGKNKVDFIPAVCVSENTGSNLY